MNNMINLENLNVYPIGTYVKFVNGTDENECAEDLPVGMILEIAIKPNGVLYFVGWWDGSSRNTEWVDELEFVLVDPTVQKIKIGFRNA